MQNTLSHLRLLARRWWRLVVLGVLLCGGTTYVISKLAHPVYRATATLIVSFQSVSSYDSVTAGLQATSTYAQLLTSPAVLDPVVSVHPKMTRQQLSAMITVTPVPNSQLIDLYVDNTDPKLAMNLANEISDQFVQFINPQLTASVLPIHATLPTDPIQPKPSQDAAIAALIGLGLALTLIFLFEWIDDRPRSAEEVQEILGLDTLAVVPGLSQKERKKNIRELPALAEACRMLCARLNAAQVVKPFKLVMVTSAVASEGKSTVAAGLSEFLALSGKRVLLVDADLRRPVLHRHFQLDNDRGLVGAFVEMTEQLAVMDGQPTVIPSLHVLTAGPRPLNAAELLQSPVAHQFFEHLKKAPQFDYVIFDASPLLPVADAQVIASYVQAVVLVSDASRTTRKVLARVRRVLGSVRTRVIGVVLNMSPWLDDGNIRQYLNEIDRPTVDFDFTPPPTTPPVDVRNMDFSTVPPSNGVVEPDIATVVLPTRQKDNRNHDDAAL